MAESPREIPDELIHAFRHAVLARDPFEALGSTNVVRGVLQTWEALLTKEAIERGASWTDVGQAIGVTRQAAWERLHDQLEQLGVELQGEGGNMSPVRRIIRREIGSPRFRSGRGHAKVICIDDENCLVFSEDDVDFDIDVDVTRLKGKRGKKVFIRSGDSDQVRKVIKKVKKVNAADLDWVEEGDEDEEVEIQEIEVDESSDDSESGLESRLTRLEEAIARIEGKLSK